MIESALHSHTDVVYDAIQVEYKDMASWYDTFWSSYTSQTLIEPLNQVAALGAAGHADVVVDVACGTGEFLRRLQKTANDNSNNMDSSSSRTKKKRSWIGVEPCPEMLQQAQQKCPPNKNKNNNNAIEFRQAPAEYLPIRDNHSVDVVVTTNAFHFFRDPKRALHEMKRILKKKGTLIITDWCNDYWIVKFYHWLEKLRWNWRFAQPYPGPLKRSELFDLVNAEGFENVEVSSYTVRVFGIFFWGMQTLKAQPISGSI